MSYDRYYSIKAQEMRAFALSATSFHAKDEFLKLSLDYEELADIAGENRQSAEASETDDLHPIY